MGCEVFISYKSIYVDIVKAICHVLESENIRCWYAPRDLDINSGGYDFDDSIMNAISNCKVVVIILTNEALDSEWVKIEIAQAQKKGKIIIPYVVNEITRENGLLMRLQNKHWIDAYPNPERKFSLLLNNVKLLLNESFKAEKGTEEDLYKIDNIDDSDFDFEEGEALYEAKDYNDAVVAFAASAERGNKKAASMLCRIFYNLGEQTDKIPNEIWEIMERQANAGYAYACFAMHTKYYKDYENYYISFDYLKKAVRDKTLGYAYLRLGIHYGWGMGVRPNHTLSMYYYKKAVELGCVEAYSFIGQEIEFGSDKCLPDVTKAVEFYRKGAEKNDTRSINRLGMCYAEGKGVDKSKEEAFSLFEKSVSLGEYEGYCNMGLYCQLDNDIENAKKYYKMAARHDEGESFANLALIYWDQGEKEEAYKWAKSGYVRKNGLCASVLGFLNESDENYKEAWNCYFARYKWVGIGAVEMARLYLEKGYRPEGVELGEIISMLDVIARNSNEDAINFLIQIFSSEEYSCKDVNKAYEYLKLGAIIGIPDKMYEYGVSFMGDKEEYFNAFKGLEWIEKAARKEYVPAIEFLLETFNGYKYKDEEKFSEWIHVAINMNLDSASVYPLICNSLEGVNSKDELKKYLIYNIKNHSPNEISALKKLIEDYNDGLIDLKDNEVDEYYNMVLYFLHNSEDDRLLPLQSLLYILDKDFNPSEVEDNQIIEGESFEKYYKYFWRSELNFFDAEKKDNVLLQLYKPLINDKSFEQVKMEFVSKISGISDFWDVANNIFDTYENLCKMFSILPVAYNKLRKEDLYPFISCKTVDSYGRDIVKCFISMYKSRQCDILNCRQPISDEKLLEVAEKAHDEDVQLFLINFVEVHIELQEILLNNKKDYVAYLNNDIQKLLDRINRFKEKLDESGIQNALTAFDENHINSIVPPKDKNETNIDDMDDDEFNRLLEEFIN